MRTRKMIRLCCSCLIAAILVGCGGSPPEPSDRPHVLLITLDSCRADHLGFHGHNRQTSPILNGMAGDGTVFTRAFTSTAGTTSSHATILSGLYQETHRVALETQKERRERTVVPHGLLMLPAMLKRHGYRTVAVTDGGNVSSAFGFHKAFEFFDDQGGGAESGTDELFRLMRKAAKRGNSVFAWYHTYEIHAPYPARGEYDGFYGSFESRFEPGAGELAAYSPETGGEPATEDVRAIKAHYDSGIHFTDLQLGELFATLDKEGFLSSCVVVVTSAHGEEFGEHGGFLHREQLYEELVHVPLLFRGEGIPVGKTDDRLACTADVAPTLLTLLGIPVPEPMKGRDLFGHDIPAADSAIFIQYGNGLYAVRTSWRKLIEKPITGRQELYDLYNDPGEQENLMYYYAHAARPLHERLKQWRSHHSISTMVPREKARMSRELKQQLEFMGE